MARTPSLSVTALFADRDARRRRDQEAAEHLQLRQREELAAFRKRLDNFVLTEEIIHSALDRIKRAFERSETELMFASFPSTFCSDGGRSVMNAGVSPINKPSAEQMAREAENPEWVRTMPAGVHKVHEYWRDNLKPGGFKLTARIINYPGGKPGDVGLFFSWPNNEHEA